MKRTGIEPVSSAWKADVLPLYQRSEEQLQEPESNPGPNDGNVGFYH